MLFFQAVVALHKHVPFIQNPVKQANEDTQDAPNANLGS